MYPLRPMRTRPLGRSGLDVPVLCLGTMTFGWSADEPTSHAVMSAALDRGITFFDTADIYSRWSSRSHAGKSEEIIGRWFAADPSRRDRVTLATKVRGQMSDDPRDQGLSREHITRSVEGSLRRLKTDRVELYQSHWWDGDVAQEESLRAYEDLVRAGKVRAIGCSNFTAEQVSEGLLVSAAQGLHRYETLQPHYNLVHRAEFEASLAGLARREGLGVIPYSPLAGGFLTGKYRRGEGAPQGSRGADSGRIQGYMRDPKSYDTLDALAAIARERGTTVAAVALSWVIDAPSITSAIIGANSVEQLVDLLPAAELVLTADERARIG